jgi:hypothetical protein
MIDIQDMPDPPVSYKMDRGSVDDYWRMMDEDCLRRGTMSDETQVAGKGYGLYILHCPCGWMTFGRVGDIPPKRCARCQTVNPDTTPEESAGHLEWRTDVACCIAMIADQQSKGTREFALKHGLMVYQVSERRWVVLQEDRPNTVTYKDEEQRGYLSLRKVHGPSPWQSVMGYIRKNTPPLPEYLK